MDLLPVGPTEWALAIIGTLIAITAIPILARPRPSLEWMEHQFISATRLQATGALLLILAATGGYLAQKRGLLAPDLDGILLGIILAILILAAITLILLQNHLRHLVIATAEWPDWAVRITAGLKLIAGLILTAFVLTS